MSQDRVEVSKPKTVLSGLGTAKVSKTVERAKATSDKVRVIHGSNDRYYPLNGKNVGDVRKGLKDSFNIPGDAIAEVDGKTVNDEFILESGMSLEFSKISGVKGFFFENY
jgi:hypothetical protein